MTKLYPSRNIFVAQSKISKAGRGVFASKSFKKGEIIEVCPVVVLKGGDVPTLKKTELYNYYFIWHAPKKIASKAAICLGFGSLYNHSYKPNATYHKLFSKNLIAFVAIRAIKKEEEITVNYNYGNPNDQSTLWTKKIKPARTVLRSHKAK